MYIPENEAVLHEVIAAYDFPETLLGVVRYGSGHINDTYCVTAKDKRYILQRISDAFDVVGLMNNIAAVTKFTAEHTSDPRGAMPMVHTLDGKPYYTDETGHYRVYDFVEDSICLQSAETPEDFYQSAIGFGTFQQMLADFPAEKLHETIPNFHNTQDRYAQFKESVELDCVGRVAETAQDIAFLMEREQTGCILQKMLDAGILPLRVTHNDTKLNNVLLDSETRKSLCVLDLDTVMAGSSLYDYGDAIRYGAATAAEDEKDTSKMHLDLHLFEVYTKGYLEAADLTDTEVEMLPMGAKLMTLECGLRFLTDHLDGVAGSVQLAPIDQVSGFFLGDGETTSIEHCTLFRSAFIDIT